jgi:hypothetical protein
MIHQITIARTAHADAQALSPNNAPVIQSFTGVPSSLNNPGETTTFNVSATDPDGDALTYTINFGDGTANGSGSQAVHAYKTKGTYTATATEPSEGATMLPPPQDDSNLLKELLRLAGPFQL